MQRSVTAEIARANQLARFGHVTHQQPRRVEVATGDEQVQRGASLAVARPDNPTPAAAS